MKSIFVLSIFTLFLALACTRTSPSAPQTTPVPPPVAEKPNSFGTPIFKGSGNEPFWSLQIDQDHQLMLKSIDDHQFTLNAPITEITRVNDANALNLTAATTDKKLTIILMENSCQDNMSGKKSSHGLQVLIKDATTGSSVLYKGCGQFLNEYLVNNHWELESINGRNIADLPIEKTPTLKINLLESKVHGFAGCNTFFGSVKMEKGRLNFGNIGLTKKACKDDTVETTMVKLLNDRAQKHTITKDGKLLMKDSEQTLIFKSKK